MFKRTALREFSPLSPTQGRRYLHWPKRSPKTLPSGSTLRIQRVRFDRPPVFSRRRIRNALIYAIPASYILYKIGQVFEIEVEIEETDEQKVVGKDTTATGIEEDEEEGSLFIPFGWPKPSPRTFYKGSDAEWQEFVKFSKDQEKHKDVQLRLVAKTRSEINQRFGEKSALGVVDPSKGRYWLEITYPPGPPQEYEVNGIELGVDFVAWSRKIVDQKEFHRLQQVVFPTGAMWASLTAMRYQFDLQFNKIRKILGLEEKFGQEATMLRRQAQLQSQLAHKEAQLRELKKKMPTGQSRPETKSTTSAEGTQEPSEASEQTETHEIARSDQKDNDLKSTGKGSPAALSLPGANASPVDEPPITPLLFWHKLMKSRKSLMIEPPRGAILVSGLVEVVGSKGKSTWDVHAAWDIKTNNLVIADWKLRKFSPKTQRPKGGN